MYAIHREPTPEEKQAWIEKQTEISRRTPDFYKKPQFFPVPEDLMKPSLGVSGISGKRNPKEITY